MIFTIQFDSIDFDTDGNKALAKRLNKEYGKNSYELEADTEDEAYNLACDSVTNESGHCINGSLYHVADIQNIKKDRSLIYTIQFDSIDFDTDGNKALAKRLNKEYGKNSYELEADNEDEAYDLACDSVTNESGYCINGSSYNVSDVEIVARR